MKIVQLKLSNWLDNYFRYEIIPNNKIEFKVYLKLFNSTNNNKIEIIKS